MDIRITSVENTNLSVRSKNALRRAGIHTVGEMLECTEESLKDIRNLGAKSIGEILLEKERYLRQLERADAEDEAPEFNDKDEERVNEYLMKKGTGIDALDMLPVRAFNLLTLKGYDKLYQIIFMSRRELSEITGMDMRLAGMIEEQCRLYLQDNLGVMLSDSTTETDAANTDILTLCRMQPYSDRIRTFVKNNDKAVTELGLSTRASNVLMRNGLEKMSDIYYYTARDFNGFRGLSDEGFNDILNKKNEYLSENEARIRAYCMGDEEALLSDDAVRNNVLDLYKKSRFGGFSLSEMRERLPSHISEERLKRVLGALLAQGALEYVDFRCYRVYPSIMELIENREDIADRSKEIIKRRLDGETLEEIGQAYGLTRERVRQITAKVFHKLGEAEGSKAVFDEEYYSYFYENYKIDKKDAAEWLGIPQYVFKFFDLAMIKNGEKPLKSALEDANIDAGLRLKIKNYLNRNRVFIDGVWVPKNRSALEIAAARKFCSDEMDFDDFARKYNEFLKTEEISEDEDLYLTEKVFRARKARMADSRFILWKQFEKLRYYDIDARDYTELLDELNLDVYENTEMSTAKLMREYPEIMHKYDIRDQYELHNLLRKVIPEGSFHDFKVGRMPMIKFGEFDRDNALYELMVNSASIDSAGNASISAERLCAIIEEEYGYSKEITMSSYLVPLSVYYDSGEYRIEKKVMSDENRRAFDAALNDDFYYIDELKEIYSQAVPGADTGEINPFNLKSMGFIVLSTYAVRNYGSAEAFFKSILTSEDIIDITEYRKRFTYVSTFSNVMMDMKRNLEIIEFEPNRILNFRKLEAADVTKDMICDFCDEVYEFAGEGRYFTIQSLCRDGFDSEMFELGFSDWFYANLLISDERFSFVKMLGNIVFYSGDISLSVKSFVGALVNKAGKIDVYDLLNDLEETYGCVSADRSDVLEKMKGTAIYHDKTLDRLYANSDIYYREIEETEAMI